MVGALSFGLSRRLWIAPMPVASCAMPHFAPMRPAPRKLTTTELARAPHRVRERAPDRAPESAPDSAPDSAPPSSLRNLGPRSDAMLAAIGIRSAGQLRRAGAVPTWLRLRRAQPGVSLNALYALAGAIDDVHWLTINRERRLALLGEVEARSAAIASDARPKPPADELLGLRNIGPAMRRDLALLGIERIAQLARADADRLYLRLQQRTGTRHDPCVWDTFAAAIHQARGGDALPWWHFTRERKRRMAEGSFLPPWEPPPQSPAPSPGLPPVRPKKKRT